MASFETLLWIIVAGVAVIPLMLFVYVLYRWIQFRKITYIIRHIRNDRVQVEKDAARVKTLEGKDVWWLRKKQRAIPIPDDDTLDIDSKGRIWHEAYWTVNKDIIPIKVSSQKGLEGVKPTTTSQRVLAWDEIKLAHDMGSGIMEKYGHVIVLGSFVLMLLVILFVFWGEIWEPMITAGNQFTSVAEKLADALQRVEIINSGKQIIN